MEEFNDLQDSLLTDTSATDQTVSLEEPDGENRVEEENLKYSELVAYIKKKYQRSRDQRRFDEERWLTAYKNFRGLYDQEVQFTNREKSQAFIKITKTKVLAAYAQILEVLFAGNKFPIGIEASPVVDGIVDAVHFDPKKPEDLPEEETPEISSTISRPDLFKLLGPLKQRLSPVKDKLEEGPGLTPSAITFEPAKEAARAMEQLIHDQLEESNISKEIRAFIFDMCFFGTGIFKGPGLLKKEYPKWDDKGKYAPLYKDIAECSQISVWDAYPDADARNMKECEDFIQRHKMNRTQLRQLKKRPFFRSESIEIAIRNGPNYQREYWENDLHDSDIMPNIDRWEVLEYWGIVDKDIAEKAGIELPSELEDFDQVQINAWICDNEILRVVLNPFTPARIPYYACPYELNPYSFFGVGVAENMEDTQLLMNGFMRLAVDNAVLSSNVILEIDETNMVDGQDLEIYPGKVFRRQGGNPGQMINSIQIANNSQEALMLFDKARQLADEATGMPSYSHGMSGIMSTGRTAAGMSMLMGAAKENIKAVVRNIDDYLLVPLGKAMFAFNMQFNFDPKYVGDLSVVARGTESLMRNEIRSQKLLQFLQLTGNPMDAPYVKRDYILRELATSLDLEADKVVNDSREAAIQASLMQEMNKLQGIDPNAQGGQGGQQGNPSGAPSVNDPTQTGGGNIGPGAAPMPGEQGDTGGGGGSIGAAQAMQGGVQGM